MRRSQLDVEQRGRVQVVIELQGVIRMEHRHLVDDTSTSLMALDDVLERGSPDAWSELVRLVAADPFGVVAERILTLCGAHSMYGTSRLWPKIIERLRSRGAS